MDLNILWFALIGILFIGFFVLEGFDFGVGTLVPFLSKKDDERRQLFNSVGPFWDANEVWLLTAGGAIFAAFPHWYATMFSSFYIALFAILVALIIRGASFEFRSLIKHPRWRSTWDWLVCISSMLPGFLWGVAIANLLVGIPIDEHMEYAGGILNLLSPYALLTGALFAMLFTLHGAIFLSLRLTGELMERALKVARALWLPTLLLLLAFVGFSYVSSEVFRKMFWTPWIAPFSDLALAALIATGWLILRKRSGWAFLMTTLCITLSGVAICLGLFPNVMISSLNPAWNLTIYNASSSPYTLTVMSWVALTALPFVLGYQAWNYWVFRKRLETHTVGHY